MNFSIVIVTYNRKKELENCLQSLRNVMLSEKMETIVVFNGELSYFERTKINFPEVKCYYIPSSSPSAARNFGVTKCQAENILFLDDDCVVPSGYFEKVSFDDKWDVLGGPDQSSPTCSRFQKILGHVLSSPLCMGKTFQRHHSHNSEKPVEADEASLILCNLWMKRSLFEKHQFDGELFRNEENHLLKKLKLEGKIIKYDPRLYVYHDRKSSYGPLAASVMKSGECRVLNFMKLPLWSEFIYFLPLIFNFLFFTWLFNLSSKLGILFFSYFVIVYIQGLWKHKAFKPDYLFMHLFILFIYSIGLLKGLFQHSWILLKDFSKEYN